MSNTFPPSAGGSGPAIDLAALSAVIATEGTDAAERAALVATLLAAGFTSTAATAVLTAYGSATVAQLTVAQNSLATYIGTRAGATELATARSDLLAAIATGGASRDLGEVVLFVPDANGNPPAGFTWLDGVLAGNTEQGRSQLDSAYWSPPTSDYVVNGGLTRQLIAVEDGAEVHRESQKQASSAVIGLRWDAAGVFTRAAVFERSADGLVASAFIFPDGLGWDNVSIGGTIEGLSTASYLGQTAGLNKFIGSFVLAGFVTRIVCWTVDALSEAVVVVFNEPDPNGPFVTNVFARLDANRLLLGSAIVNLATGVVSAATLPSGFPLGFSLQAASVQCSRVVAQESYTEWGVGDISADIDGVVTYARIGGNWYIPELVSGGGPIVVSADGNVWGFNSSTIWRAGLDGAAQQVAGMHPGILPLTNSLFVRSVMPALDMLNEPSSFNYLVEDKVNTGLDGRPWGAGIDMDLNIGAMMATFQRKAVYVGI